MQIAGYSLAAVLFATTIGYVMTGSRSERLNQLLSVGPLRTLGTYSYGLYVYHQPILAGVGLLCARTAWLQASRPETSFAIELALFAAVLLAVVPASYHLFEKPLMDLRERFAASRA
jgi:peptidoglycan/LPS O-acetylase OafA/YrhL